MSRAKRFNELRKRGISFRPSLFTVSQPLVYWRGRNATLWTDYAE